MEKKRAIIIGSETKSAIIMGNQAADGLIVENNAGSRTQMGLNEMPENN